jgi:hypothetical protein
MRFNEMRFKLTIWQMMVFVALVSACLLMWRYLFIDNKPGDILKSMVSAMEGESTVYAENFREPAFRSLRIGMTERQVEDLMGTPLARGDWKEIHYRPGGEVGERIEGDIWSYSRPFKRNGDYWIREVYIKDHLLSRVNDGFHMD